ncbi:hypothetical protein [Actinoallomurus sp. CA-150999]|uniref:hypothetical protein n=1 Tax=Actinoallomurus sp. CA-150999 TaxID=3239887 RepID=UPI003D92044C
MVRVPRLLSFEMPIGVFADRSDPGHIDWRDLVVALPVGPRRSDAPTSIEFSNNHPHQPKRRSGASRDAYAEDRSAVGWDEALLVA